MSHDLSEHDEFALRILRRANEPVTVNYVADGIVYGRVGNRRPARPPELKATKVMLEHLCAVGRVAKTEQESGVTLYMIMGLLDVIANASSGA